MGNILKDTLLTGIGILSLSTQKIEAFASTFAEENKLSLEEGQRLLDSILKKKDELSQDIELKINEKVAQALSKMNIATKEDMARLEARITMLERELNKQD